MRFERRSGKTSVSKAKTIAIVGPGLIGASIGLAVRHANLAGTIVGIGRRQESLDQAKKVGAVDHTTTNLAAGVADAALVVLATPVALIARQAIEAAAATGDDCLITDAGSTKSEIVAEIEAAAAAAKFVGSHPLAGSHHSGPEHANARLFEDRTVVVTPTPRTAPSVIGEVSQFWQALGGQVVTMTPDEHDAALAVTSHLPHLAAAAIAASTPDRYAALVATGWLDTTRIAAGDAGLWTQILRSNRAGVLAALDQLEDQLGRFRQAIAGDQAAQLEQLLKEAKRTRDALGS